MYRKLNKQAAGTAFEEVMFNNSGLLSGSVGNLIGLARDVEGNEQERKELTNKTLLWHLIPGVGAHDLSRRRKSLSKELGGGSGLKKLLSERIGAGITAPLLTMLVTGGIGAGVGALRGEDIGDWAAAGAGVGAAGSVLANLGSAIAAAFTDRRTKEEQKKYETSGGSTATNYLLPGSGVYNALKSTGYLQGESEKYRK